MLNDVYLVRVFRIKEHLKLDRKVMLVFSKNSFVLNPADAVIKAEIMQASHIVKKIF